MALAYPIQKFQDWFTQQWVILWGKKFDPAKALWLIGPFGNLNGIGEDFINQLAAKENLIVERETSSHGLIPSIGVLSLSESELSIVSKQVIDFYEKTAKYNLFLTVKWNPFFRVFGVLVNTLFSKRINQLNIPTENSKVPDSLTSEIVRLLDAKTNEVKYTIWFRTIKTSNRVAYAGVYGTCVLPSGKTCIKAVFPLPNGNASVIMTPSVGENGELILDSSGKNFGDAGFYFLLNDSKGNYWAQFIRSFRDRLIVREEYGHISAEQKITLWGLKVLEFSYKIRVKDQV